MLMDKKKEAALLRTFRTYTFVLPNEIEYRRLIRKLMETYDYERLIFEVRNLDHLQCEVWKPHQPSLEEQLASSKTVQPRSSSPGLSGLQAR
jgi:hypothetical protein